MIPSLWTPPPPNTHTHLRVYPNSFGDLHTLSLVWAEQSSGCGGSPMLADRGKKSRVTGYFPGSQGGESVSISPLTFLWSHRWSASPPPPSSHSPTEHSPLSTAVSLFFLCQPIHLALFAQLQQSNPPTDKEIKFP